MDKDLSGCFVSPFRDLFVSHFNLSVNGGSFQRLQIALQAADLLVLLDQQREQISMVWERVAGMIYRHAMLAGRFQQIFQNLAVS